MLNVEVFSKTPAGRDALASRQSGLTPRLRSALIMIDGHRSLAELRPLLAPLGEPRELLETLHTRGLIESDLDLPPMPEFPALGHEASVLP